MALKDTPNGYNPYEVASALQKAIRRGQEYQAFWWAHELVLNHSVPWLWNRLEVIACEDVGMGNPAAIGIVHACREAWERVNDKKSIDKIEWSILAHPIIVMCRSQKSRSADDLSHLVWLRKEGRDPITREPGVNKPEHLEVPKEARDMHTGLGKRALIDEARRQGIDPEAHMTKHFREVSARLDNPAKDVSSDGTNWTEEVCKLQGADPSIALSPAEIRASEPAEAPK